MHARGAHGVGSTDDDVDGAGDIIFLYGATTHYTGGLTLENDQQLISQSHGLTVNGTSLVIGERRQRHRRRRRGARSGGTGNNIQGINFGVTSGFALSGSTVGNSTATPSPRARSTTPPAAA